MKPEVQPSIGTIFIKREDVDDMIDKCDVHWLKPKKDLRWFWQWFYVRLLFAKGHWSKVPMFVQSLAVMFNLSKWGPNVSIISGASFADVTENNFLKLLFNATLWANVAINATSSPITIISVAAHTADPGESGTQATSESAYTSYARVSVTRDSSNWTVTANSVSPAATIGFPAGTGGSGTITHWSVGKTASGSTDIFLSGTVTPNIVTGNTITPQLSTASAITVD